jgi:hypothetical protein
MVKKSSVIVSAWLPGIISIAMQWLIQQAWQVFRLGSMLFKDPRVLGLQRPMFFHVEANCKK